MKKTTSIRVWRQLRKQRKMFQKMFKPVQTETEAIWAVRSADLLIGMAETASLDLNEILQELYRWLHSKLLDVIRNGGRRIDYSLPGGRRLTPDILIRVMNGISDFLNKQMFHLDRRLQLENSFLNLIRQ